MTPTQKQHQIKNITKQIAQAQEKMNNLSLLPFVVPQLVR
jgi:hypothetical protein